MGAPDHRLPGPQGRYLSERPRALDVVLAVEASLAGGGFTLTRDSVAGRRAVIARSGRFGRGPRGSLRPVFVLVAVFKAGMAGREHLDRFSDEAAQYATTIRGGPGSGISAVAVAVVEAVQGPEEAGWARAGGVRAFPVLVDLAAGRVTCPEERADLRRLVQQHVAAVVGAPG